MINLGIATQKLDMLNDSNDNDSLSWLTIGEFLVGEWFYEQKANHTIDH